MVVAMALRMAMDMLFQTVTRKTSVFSPFSFMFCLDILFDFRLFCIKHVFVPHVAAGVGGY